MQRLYSTVRPHRQRDMSATTMEKKFDERSWQVWLAVLSP